MDHEVVESAIFCAGLVGVAFLVMIGVFVTGILCYFNSFCRNNIKKINEKIMNMRKM